MDEHSRTSGPDLQDQIRVLSERRWLIIASVILTALAAYLYAVQREETYKASASILIEQNDLGSSVVGITGQAPVDPDREAATILELLEQPVLAQRVAEENPKLGVTADELLEKVSGRAEGTSSLISVDATDASPAQAARIANAYAREFVAFRTDSARERVDTALESVERQLATARESGRERAATRLRREREEVSLLASLQTGDAQLVQPATRPVSPIGLSPLQSALFGALLGLIIGIALAFLLNRLDSHIKRPEEVEAVFPGVPTVGMLPSWRGRRGRKAEAESFRALPTTLSSLDPDRRLRSLLVTSATVGEGKTTTSLNLALAMAERDESVVLLEGDLRRRGLSERLGLTDRLGVSNVLNGEGTLDSYVVDVSLNGKPRLKAHQRVNGHANGNGQGTATATALRGMVRMIPAGSVADNPHALLRGHALDDLLEDAIEHADRVVIDGTPVGLVTDMLPLASRVDGVLLVVHLQHTKRTDLKRLAQQLHQIGVRPFALVIFGVQMDRSYDAYLTS